jgi:hypothetical protein
MPTVLPTLRLKLIAPASLALLSACGSTPAEVRPGPPPQSVQQVVESAALKTRVIIRGRAAPLGAVGFVLYDRTASIWVLAPRERVLGLRAGQTVTVTGRPDRLTQDQSIRLANAVARGRLAPRPGFDRVVAARRNRGETFIDAGVDTGRRSSQE